MKPTIGNASELISRALEQNVDLIGTRRNYVDYLANRPPRGAGGRAWSFTDAGEPVILKKVQEDVAQHKGPIWTPCDLSAAEDANGLDMTVHPNGWHCFVPSAPCSVGT